MSTTPEQKARLAYLFEQITNMENVRLDVTHNGGQRPRAPKWLFEAVLYYNEPEAENIIGEGFGDTALDALEDLWMQVKP